MKKTCLAVSLSLIAVILSAACNGQNSGENKKRVIAVIPKGVSNYF